MRYYKSTIALAVLAGVGLAACGGGSSGGGGGNGDSSGPDGGSWQEDFSSSDRYGVSETNFVIDASSLAVDTDADIDSAFSTSLSTPSGNPVTPADYFGAVDPDGDAWWEGWTVRNDNIEGNLPGDDFHPLQAEIEDGTITPAAASACDTIGEGDGLADGGSVELFGAEFPVCVITDGDLDGEHTLPNNHVFVLDGTVQVGNGDVESAADPSSVREDVLTIEEGTQVYGISDTDPSLVITRGSRIEAVGTADLPIIMAAVDGDGGVAGEGEVITDADPEDISGRGRWGSLVISGYGEVNNGDDNDQTTTEAVPDGVERWFGGTDNSDSSGTIEYVILAETGEAFRPDEEVQGLTIEGSGSGTTISHVQVTNSDDDGIEWFGGAANADHIVIQGVTDDSLDMDLGYQGTVQHALVIQGDSHGDRGIESDNNGDDFGAEPKTSPIIANLTIIGDAGNDGSTMGALHREGFGGQVYRAAYADLDTVNGRSGQFGSGCLDVDSELDGELEYGDVLFNCTSGSLVDDDD